MIRAPVPNAKISMLENCDSQQLLKIFESSMKTGSNSTKYGSLSEIWGALFSQLFLSPMELIDEMQSGEHRFGEETESMLREYINADCKRGGAFVLDVIQKGGMIDRSALMMMADPEDLAGIVHEGTTALHLLVNACDKRMRPTLIKRVGRRLLSSVYDRNGIPVLMSIFALSDLCRYDLDAITEVFSKDDLKKVMAKTRMGKSAFDVFTEISASVKTVPRERNTFSAAQVVKTMSMGRGGSSQIDTPLQTDRGTLPRVKAATDKKVELDKGSITNTSERDKPAISKSPKDSGKMMKIMIVDDDDIIRHLLKLRLEMLGCEVCAMAETGEAAVNLAGETKPDIVFMDINMPGRMDGINAAREIKTHSDPRLVFVTAYSEEEILVRARELHPDGYILKPFSDQDLRVALEFTK